MSGNYDAKFLVNLFLNHQLIMLPNIQPNFRLCFCLNIANVIGVYLMLPSSAYLNEKVYTVQNPLKIFHIEKHFGKIHYLQICN
jgi:hypothetical protein